MKKRLDILALEQGLETTRERVQALIMSGQVYVNNERATKPGDMYAEDTLLELRGEKIKYVSRGGYKLEKAIKTFNISLQGKTCMDIGCSTGGFIDCMLQNGIKKVLGVDVGYGQLDWKLRQDERVFLLEKTNIRNVTRADIKDFDINFVTVDVSFISLTKVLPPISVLVADACEFVCLIKPQFEAEKTEVGKGGIIKDAKLHKKILNKIINFLSGMNALLLGLTFSPIKGAKGNIEYLIYFKLFRENSAQNVLENMKFSDIIENVVGKACKELN